MCLSTVLVARTVGMLVGRRDCDLASKIQVLAGEGQPPWE